MYGDDGVELENSQNVFLGDDDRMIEKEIVFSVRMAYIVL